MIRAAAVSRRTSFESPYPVTIAPRAKAIMDILTSTIWGEQPVQTWALSDKSEQLIAYLPLFPEREFSPGNEEFLMAHLWDCIMDREARS